jgi:predicted nucleotidyltransferase
MATDSNLKIQVGDEEIIADAATTKAILDFQKESQAAEAAIKAAKESARAEAESKLLALGLTVDDLKALGLLNG